MFNRPAAHEIPDGPSPRPKRGSAPPARIASSKTRGYLRKSKRRASGDAELDAGRLPQLDILARRFAPDPATIPDITVELVPLHLYDELGTVRAGSVA